MDMEELLGLDAGDFDDVDFAASDEEDSSDKGSTTGAAPAVSGALPAEGSSSVVDGVAPATEATSPSAVTTVIKV